MKNHKIVRSRSCMKMIYGRATGPVFSNCIFSVLNIFSEFQKSVKGLLLARSGNQKPSKTMQFRPRTVNFSPDWVTNSWSHFISLGIKSPMVFRQLFGAGRSRVRICRKVFLAAPILNFQKNIGFVCVRPNLPSQIGRSKMVQTMCNQGTRFSNFLSFGSYALRIFYNL